MKEINSVVKSNHIGQRLSYGTDEMTTPNMVIMETLSNNVLSQQWTLFYNLQKVFSKKFQSKIDIKTNRNNFLANF